MYPNRVALLKNLEEMRSSKVLVYVTGDRPGMEAQIHSEILDYFADQLDTIGLPRKVSLYLYSRGGDTLAGWSIVNLIRQFCKEFEVIVPSKAHSTATLIALGADRIVMTKQATLGPIDPSVNSPLNPQIPGAPPNARLPISVEAVAGYFELARSQGIDQEGMTSAFLRLAEHVHPIALGNVSRARAQIQRLAERLLRFHMQDETSVKRIISVLCNESGSHDYTICRREARGDLGLPVETPDDSLYELVRDIYLDIRTELELNTNFNPNVLLGTAPTVSYSATRGLLESISGGSHRFITEGVLSKRQVQTQMGVVDGINDQRNYEGWRYEGPSVSPSAE